MKGIGGAPTRATTLPTDGAERKQYPIASGFLDYFPDAVAAVAHLSWVGNEQHNPGVALHWDRSKSGDEADTFQRHFLERGTLDKDGIRHSAKVAWRAMAMLQKEIEAEQGAVLTRKRAKDDEQVCGARNYDNYICSLLPGHTVSHAAYGVFDNVIAEWPSAGLQSEDFPAPDSVASGVDDTAPAPLGAEVVPVLSAEGHATAYRPARLMGQVEHFAAYGQHLRINPADPRD
jgi:hypothetical protein